MAHHQLALVENEAPSSDEALYNALLAALSSTARGRAFLEEHARRVRAADTAAALAALARIEAMLVKQQTAAVHAPAPVRADVVEMRETNSDEAYLPFEFDPLDIDAVEVAPEPIRAADLQQVREELLAQVRALSPEERIALFS
jgi:hypothetical protein